MRFPAAPFRPFGTVVRLEAAVPNLVCDEKRVLLESKDATGVRVGRFNLARGGCGLLSRRGRVHRKQPMGAAYPPGSGKTPEFVFGTAEHRLELPRICIDGQEILCRILSCQRFKRRTGRTRGSRIDSGQPRTAAPGPRP